MVSFVNPIYVYRKNIPNKPSRFELIQEVQRGTFKHTKKLNIIFTRIFFILYLLFISLCPWSFFSLSNTFTLGKFYTFVQCMLIGFPLYHPASNFILSPSLPSALCPFYLILFLLLIQFSPISACVHTSVFLCFGAWLPAARPKEIYFFLHQFYPFNCPKLP